MGCKEHPYCIRIGKGCPLFVVAVPHPGNKPKQDFVKIIHPGQGRYNTDKEIFWLTHTDILLKTSTKVVPYFGFHNLFFSALITAFFAARPRKGAKLKGEFDFAVQSAAVLYWRKVYVC